MKGRSQAAVDFRIRPYEDSDQAQVLELLNEALGPGPAGERSAEFYRWKHLGNPFGRSLMLVAETDGRIIGLRAFLRWRFRVGGRDVVAARPVDTATHPDYQGRGVFSALTREGLRLVRGEVDLLFNTPNRQSLPGYLKMGWQELDSVPVSIKVRRPLRFIGGLHSIRGGGGQPAPPRPPVRADPAEKVLEDARELSELLRLGVVPESRFGTPRDMEYLRWRYASAPGLDYRAVTQAEHGRLQGLAVFRVRARGSLWETTLAEVIVPPDAAAARKLIVAVARASRTDLVTGHFTPASATGRAARLAGFLRSPRGITFVVHPLSRIEPDPMRLSNWAFTLGDLEVF